MGDEMELGGWYLNCLNEWLEWMRVVKAEC